MMVVMALVTTFAATPALDFLVGRSGRGMPQAAFRLRSQRRRGRIPPCRVGLG
jgi:hypothetical protein